MTEIAGSETALSMNAFSVTVYEFLKRFMKNENTTQMGDVVQRVVRVSFGPSPNNKMLPDTRFHEQKRRPSNPLHYTLAKNRERGAWATFETSRC